MTRLLRLFLLPLLLLPLLLLSVLARPASAEDAASAYQLNPTHAGATSTPNLTPPLVKAWSVTLGDKISYPLIARGKVFVTVGISSSAGYSAKLYALNAQTGQIVWGPKVIPSYEWANAAYDSGLVFVIDEGGVLRAYNADTGAYLWHKRMPGQYEFSSPPSAHNGTVYVGGAGEGGTLYAVKETTGQILWTADVENGDNSSPVVASDGVYVSYAGPQTYKFDPLSGDLLWHYDSGGEGGGGKTAVLYGGRLYVRESGIQYPAGSNNFYDGLVLGSTDGSIQRPFGPGYTARYTAPAFSGGIGIFVNGTVQAQNAASGAALWSFMPASDTVVTAPIIVNSIVYVGTSNGVLYGLDLKTGKVRWHDAPGGSFLGPDEQNVSQPLTGLAAAQSLLVVPTSQALVAYRQAATP